MSTFHPLVSIVIPVYNGSNFLREAIDSALAQTYDNCEILVINDGSTDGGATERIALSYGDKIRYFNKKNGGVATALNMGIEQMRGEYFSWLSHDDIYLPCKVAVQVAHMQSTQCKDAVLYTDYETIDYTGRILETFSLAGTESTEFFFSLFMENFLHGCTLLIPRKLFDVVGCFRDNLPSVQDYDLWFGMSQRASFYHVAIVAVQGRCHSEQGSKTMSGHHRARRGLNWKWLPEAVTSAMTVYNWTLLDTAKKLLFHRIKQTAYPEAVDLLLFALTRMGWGDRIFFVGSVISFYTKKMVAKICMWVK